MKITFLGTGTSQGIPIVSCTCQVCQSKNHKDKRLRSSIYIESDQNERILIDTSPDLRAQLLKNNIDKVDAILYTHEHSDHTAGIDDIRPINFKQRANIPIYAMPRVVEDLRDRFKYIFVNDYYPGIPMLTLHEIEDPFSIKDVDIIPIPIMHGNLEILGFRIGSFAYLTDVKTIPESSLALLENLDVLVINALRIEEHYSHMNLKEAIQAIELINAKENYLTHISHHLGRHENVENELPQNVKLAYDGMSLKTI